VHLGVEILDAAGAAPAAAVGLDAVGAHFLAIGEEARADRPVGSELVVVIFGDAAAELENLEEAADRHVRAQIAAGLAAIEHRGFGLLVGIEREADRDAVFEGVMADRDADVEIAVDVRDAARDIADSPGGVRQLVLQIGERGDVRVGAGEGLLAQWPGQHVAANVEVVELGVSAVGMGHEVPADRHVDRQIARAFIGRRAVLQQRVGGDGLVRHVARDAGIDHVDHAADGRRAEQQCRRSTQHFDPLRGQGVNGDLVVGIGGRQVERADAVDQDADALARQAAKDRARGGRAKARGGDAGKLLERVADARARLVRQGFGVHHRHAAEDIACLTPNAGDDDRLVDVGMLRGRVAGDGSRSRRVCRQERYRFRRRRRLGGIVTGRRVLRERWSER